MRRGITVLEVVLALAVLVCALVPLIEAARSGAATVRPRETDFLVANVAAGILERLAAPPVMIDDLREQYANGADLTTDQLLELAGEVFGELPDDVQARARDAGLALKLERTERLLTTEADGSISTGLEEWTATVSWTQDGRPKTRRFTRVTAQG